MREPIVWDQPEDSAFSDDMMELIKFVTKHHDHSFEVSVDTPGSMLRVTATPPRSREDILAEIGALKKELEALDAR